MPRPNYVNVHVPPGGHRETWLKAVCDRLGLDHNHRDYLVAIDAALAAMVAELTKGEDEMNAPNVPPFCELCEGHGELAEVVRGFQHSQYDGQPWTATVEASDDNRNDVIRPHLCPRCNGSGFKN